MSTVTYPQTIHHTDADGGTWSITYRAPMVRNLSGLGVIAVELDQTHDYSDGTSHRSVWQFTADINRVLFSIKHPDGSWSPVSSVSAPERFGSFSSPADLVRWARAFADAAVDAD